MKVTRTDIAKAFVSQADQKSIEHAVKELAALLLEERMHDQVEEIILDIAREYQLQHGVVEAEARTAQKLSAEVKKQLSERVRATTGAKKVVLHEEIDRTLLGGVVLSAPDMELDLSLQSKLMKLKA
ncbi:F0F1 ATP synthase subunit delta [Candidatus Saccharibacteria bacterium]|nr:F0F1 ATP synthase subunit delta [Candidatus Saccharibacteria bacterium]